LSIVVHGGRALGWDLRRTRIAAFTPLRHENLTQSFVPAVEGGAHWVSVVELLRFAAALQFDPCAAGRRIAKTSRRLQLIFEPVSFERVAETDGRGRASCRS
jgi:hypothetical protein